MVRTVLALTLLLTLALSTTAAACPSCGVHVAVDSVRMDVADTASTLIFQIRALDGTPPDSGRAVVMQFNGNRAKCLNVPVLKTAVSGGIGTYRGNLPWTYGSVSVINSYSGRIDFAGDVFEFTVPTDGKPGAVKTVTDGSTVNQVAATTAPTAAPTTAPTTVPTTAPTAEPVAAAEPQPATDPWPPLSQPMAWLGAVAILATLAGAYVDRRRALAKATA